MRLAGGDLEGAMLKKALVVMGALIVGSLAVVPGAEAVTPGLFKPNTPTSYTLTTPTRVTCYAQDGTTAKLTFGGTGYAGTPYIGKQSWSCPNTVPAQYSKGMLVNQEAVPTIPNAAVINGCFVTVTAGATPITGQTLQAIAAQAAGDHNYCGFNVKPLGALKVDATTARAGSANGGAQLDWSEYKLKVGANEYGQVSVRPLDDANRLITVEYWYLPSGYTPPVPGGADQYSVDAYGAAIVTGYPPALKNQKVVMSIFLTQ